MGSPLTSWQLPIIHTGKKSSRDEWAEKLKKISMTRKVQDLHTNLMLTTHGAL
jgi:hypothetical protein